MPLLDPERVRAVVDDIARDLDQYPLGDAFTTAFFLYRERAYGIAGDVERRLEELAERAAETPLGPQLFGGWTGIGWLRAHAGLDDESDIDLEQLLADAIASRWDGDYDLISGLVGIGVYALERRARGSTSGLLDAIVDRLAACAEPTGAWRTDPRFLTPELRDQYPAGWYNLGLAHGMPGAIAVLGAAAAAGNARARPLLDRAVGFALAHQLPGGGFASTCDHRCPTRAAWCYGDPGVAIALLGAAHAVGEPAWEQAAIALGKLAARRPVETCGVVDPSLCHGAAGLAHIFHRFYRATGDAEFRDAAIAWLERTLAMRTPGTGVGGFRYWSGEWHDNATLLCGATGIGLVLLAAGTHLAPDWDRVLLCSTYTSRSASITTAPSENAIRATIGATQLRLPAT